MVALQGYGWLPDQRRRSRDGVVQARVLGQRAVGLCGPDAARFFYDENNVTRRTAIPEPVQSTLFGHGAVHTLDGEAHRVRKTMFMTLLTGPGVAGLVEQAEAAWDDAVASWSPGQRVVLFDEASRVITRAVCRWAGLPLEDTEVPEVAARLVALVDGFATAGPRHWRARRARAGLERRIAKLIDQVRSGAAAAPPESALATIAEHRDASGEPLDSRVAAVEVLNVIRPTVAVCWFVAYSAHAMHLWPEHREALQARRPGYAEAFTHEVRRFYPFAPFIGGRAVRDLTWQGQPIPSGTLVLLDLYGQNHDNLLWPDPYRFAPERFLDRHIGAYDLVPQGGGDPRTGHRCPGEQITIALLEALVPRLADLDYDVPAQDLEISLQRVPARPASGVVIVPATTPSTAADQPPARQGTRSR
ncbi:CypC protein [Actinoplanes friuliensis DSM 7358]|uniref:CypC protein n=2 Tax=Actinoplanes friuliensis TaxID=196914 RepID=U5W474_9ACTN|nr:CypC protein [Actinoplanes friuliensis DSM 7358]